MCGSLPGCGATAPAGRGFAVGRAGCWSAVIRAVSRDPGWPRLLRGWRARGAFCERGAPLRWPAPLRTACARGREAPERVRDDGPGPGCDRAVACRLCGYGRWRSLRRTPPAVSARRWVCSLAGGQGTPRSGEGVVAPQARSVRTALQACRDPDGRGVCCLSWRRGASVESRRATQEPGRGAPRAGNGGEAPVPHRAV